ncbi:MFS transporter [Aeromicrobium sp. YIM 150415]|uniref:MFS transporter n=1 Tax=Aeromicrobium sp. YIM 150415 TaxID=2803912 RepID=UPI00196354B8|nr:MFS transporter [Aeromicrobium sp. YIM 150415]MBM9463307.1 MFS transporter [Aeromicrobium sp. YIM 150415]
MSVRSRFLVLLALRWSATGLIIPVALLLPLSRGLSVTEVGAVTAAQGIVVLVMEVPSGVLTDSWGRRPVFVLSGVVAIIAYGLQLAAHSVIAFAVAWAVSGLFRALDSGPLEAWFVDAENARGAADRVPSSLASAGGVISGSIAAGSLASAGLLWLAPWAPATTLAVPYAAAMVLVTAQVLTACLVMERAPLTRAAPPTGWREALGGGLRLVAGPALRTLAVAMLFVAVGVSALELLMPVRLDEFSADPATAGTAMGVVTAVAWGLGSLGALVASQVLRHRRAAAVAVVLILVEGLGLVTMALATGPTVLIIGFWIAYLVHTAFGAAYNSLVHARVDDAHRGTALSVTSMAFLGSAAGAGIVLGALSDAMSPSLALLVGGAALVAAAALVGRGGQAQSSTRASA